MLAIPKSRSLAFLLLAMVVSCDFGGRAREEAQRKAQQIKTAQAVELDKVLETIVILDTQSAFVYNKAVEFPWSDKKWEQNWIEGLSLWQYYEDETKKAVQKVDSIVFPTYGEPEADKAMKAAKEELVAAFKARAQAAALNKSLAHDLWSGESDIGKVRNTRRIVHETNNASVGHFLRGMAKAQGVIKALNIQAEFTANGTPDERRPKPVLGTYALVYEGMEVTPKEARGINLFHQVIPVGAPTISAMKGLLVRRRNAAGKLHLGFEVMAEIDRALFFAGENMPNSKRQIFRNSIIDEIVALDRSPD